MLKFSHKSSFRGVINQHSRIIAFLLFAVPLFLAFYFLLLPHWKQAVVARQWERQRISREIEEKKEFSSTLSAWEEYYTNASEETLQRVSQALPEDLKQEEIYAQLEALFANRGITLASVTLSKEQKEIMPGISRARVTVTVTAANYEAYKQAIEDIEGNLRLFDIESMEYASDVSLSTIKFFTYYLTSERKSEKQ